MRILLKFFFYVLLILQALASEAQLYLPRQAALDSAMKNNPQVLVSMKNVSKERILKKGSVVIEKTDIWMEAPSASFYALGLQQYLSFPTVYMNQSKMQKENIKLAESEVSISRNDVKKSTEQIYLELQYAHARLLTLHYQDSIYGRLLRATEKRYSVGDAAYLEKVLEETKFMEVKNGMMQSMRDISSFRNQLINITGIEADSLTVDQLNKYEFTWTMQDSALVKNGPAARYFAANIGVSRRHYLLQRSLLWPNVFVGYLNQGSRNSDVSYRFRFGIALPLWLPSYASKVKGARIGIDIAQMQYKASVNKLQRDYLRIYSDLEKHRLNLRYFEETALKQSEEIIRSSTILYNSGEISYFAYLQGLTQGMSIKMAYIEAIRFYNMSLIELKYLISE